MRLPAETVLPSGMRMYRSRTVCLDNPSGRAEGLHALMPSHTVIPHFGLLFGLDYRFRLRVDLAIASFPPTGGLLPTSPNARERGMDLAFLYKKKEAVGTCCCARNYSAGPNRASIA